MYLIQKKEFLTPATVLMEVEAPWIAQSGHPGQFLIVIPDAHGERIPLTICDIDHELGLVTIVFQIVGDSTRKLADMEQGDNLYTIVGPLGKHAEGSNKPLRAEPQSAHPFCRRRRRHRSSLSSSQMGLPLWPLFRHHHRRSQQGLHLL